MLGPNRIRKDTMIKYQEAGHPRSRGWKQEGDVAAVFVFVFVIKYKAGEAGRGCSDWDETRREKVPTGMVGPRAAGQSLLLLCTTTIHGG